ncbi:glycosyltransferase family 4 protein, partial [bacterium]|nr:glycosyltransferase family 4 protein [bacterium]
MRILVLSEMFPRPTNPVLGGFVLSECKALSRHGVRFGAISPIPYSPRLLWRYPRWRRYGETPPR